MEIPFHQSLLQSGFREYAIGVDPQEELRTIAPDDLESHEALMVLSQEVERSAMAIDMLHGDGPGRILILVQVDVGGSRFLRIPMSAEHERIIRPEPLTIPGRKDDEPSGKGFRETLKPDMPRGGIEGVLDSEPRSRGGFFDSADDDQMPLPPLPIGDEALMHRGDDEKPFLKRSGHFPSDRIGSNEVQSSEESVFLGYRHESVMNPSDLFHIAWRGFFDAVVEGEPGDPLLPIGQKLP